MDRFFKPAKVNTCEINYIDYGNVFKPSGDGNNKGSILTMIFSSRPDTISLFYPPAQYSTDPSYPYSYEATENLESIRMGILGFIENECGQHLSYSTIFVFAYLACMSATEPKHFKIVQMLLLCSIVILPSLKAGIIADVQENGDQEEKLIINAFLDCVFVKYENLTHSSFTPLNTGQLIEEFVNNLSEWYMSRNICAIIENSVPTPRVSRRNTTCSIIPTIDYNTRESSPDEWE